MSQFRIVMSNRYYDIPYDITIFYYDTALGDGTYLYDVTIWIIISLWVL